MDVPEVEQYENLTSHLRYLNEKILQAFSLFIKLATAIIGGVFYIHLNLDLNDPRRVGIGVLASVILTVVGAGVIILILTNLVAWRRYRKTLSAEYPAIPLGSGVNWWFGEALMCLLIVLTSIAFWAGNPL